MTVASRRCKKSATSVRSPVCGSNQSPPSSRPLPAPSSWRCLCAIDDFMLPNECDAEPFRHTDMRTHTHSHSHPTPPFREQAHLARQHPARGSQAAVSPPSSGSAAGRSPASSLPPSSPSYLPGRRATSELATPTGAAPPRGLGRAAYSPISPRGRLAQRSTRASRWPPRGRRGRCRACARCARRGEARCGRRRDRLCVSGPRRRRSVPSLSVCGGG